MNTYQFNYVVTVEKIGLIRAESEEEAKDKLDEILLTKNKDLSIYEVEKYGSKVVEKRGLGIDYNSIKSVEESDSLEYMSPQEWEDNYLL